jgi:predicted nucleic acid-binding protein
LAYILVDTCVFLRLPAEYKKTLDCILEVGDIIVVTGKILKEYKGRASSSILLLQGFLQDLRQKGRIRFLDASVVRAACRRRTRARAVNYPPHEKDKKWVDTAIAASAPYIVSTNDHLLRLRPNRSNGGTVEVMDPSRYRRIRCPDEAD